jgi:hypothetical protein
MRKRVLGGIGFVLGFACAVSAETLVIYSEYTDGQVEMRPEWTEPQFQNDWEWEGGIGEWWGGLTCTVIPFQLPNLGAVDSPFTNASLAVGVHNIQNAFNDVDLYGIRVDTNSSILAADYYNGAAPDPGATLIQASFLTPLSTVGYGGSNNVTDVTGDANLLSYLNTAYDNGNGAESFVFLRLSLHSDLYVGDYYKVSMRNAGQQAEWPVLTLETSVSDTDEDGLPDRWELDNGLDPYDNGSVDINNGAIGDPDSDSLVNSNEYALGTDPQNPDTDNDGLIDGSEVYTNFTDVLVWDTDGDRLSDGDEVNNIGSDPLSKHSDADGEDDGLEIWQGTDPLDPESNSAALGLIIVDGSREDIYGDAVAAQTLNTAWDDNLDELNAAYASIQNDRLFLMITGNMNTNWNKVDIFIDSTDAVTTNFLETAGNGNTANMDGLFFDDGFSPDYHMSLRLGDWNGWNFNLDWADLSTKAVSWHLNLFEGEMEGIGYMGPGDASSSAMAIAFNNSNSNGLVYGTGAANTPDVLAVTTGLELSIALSDLGEPYGDIRIAVMMTGGEHDNFSNQTLGGLPAPWGALGSPSNLNFNAISGDQFFTFAGRPLPAPSIAAMQMNAGNTQVQLGLTGLIAGENYMIQDTAELTMGFSDVAGSGFTAASTNAQVVLPVDTDAEPIMFYQVAAPN